MGRDMILTQSLTSYGVVMQYMQTLVSVLELAMFIPLEWHFKSVDLE